MDKSERKRLRDQYKSQVALDEQKQALIIQGREQRGWELLRRHLSTATPWQLHIYADQSNFDCNRRGIEFVLDNPQLCAATAVLIFWKLGADYYARYTADEIREFQRPTDRLVWTIEQRVRDGFYSPGAIAYDPMVACGYPGEYSNLGPIKRIVSEVMYRSFKGKELSPTDYEGFDDGIPVAVARAKNAL
jgi:Domain of unknown function (DUF4274)